jgi:AraC-like DNA-binding protein
LTGTQLIVVSSRKIRCSKVLFGSKGGWADRNAFGEEAQKTMTPDTFSTQPLRSLDQFEAWREWHQPVLDFLPQQSTRYGFPAEVHLWKFGGLAMSRTSVPPVRVARTKSNLRHDPMDHWVISYCFRGTHFTNTAGTALEVPAQVPFLSSLGQEFLHERTHIDRVSFLMARDAFRDIAPLLDGACGLLLDASLGHVLGDFMLALERHLPAVTEDDFPRLTNAFGAMVAAAAAPSAERTSLAKPLIDVGRKERVRQAVRRHLRTPTLEPKTLARLVGVSRSNLYRLFEDTGGVARYIQRERLLEAHAILSDPEKVQSISRIAEDLCFADASSFSRIFKREFGCTPTEARYAALSGLELGVTPKTSGANFGNLLRGI